jgi:uncharacterized RDD family membrane protein YckC
MKCPKCSYLGFETGDRCRNCGYDFSLLAGRPEPPDPDLKLQVPDEMPPDADRLWMDRLHSVVEEVAEAHEMPDRVLETEPALAGPSSTVTLEPPIAPRAETAYPLFAPRAEDASAPRAEDDDEPLIKFPAAPRAPLSVRRTPEQPRLRPSGRAGPSDEPPLSLEFADESFSPPKPVGASVEAMESLGEDERVGTGDDVSSLVRRMAAGLTDHVILFSIDLIVLYSTLRMAGLTMSDWQLLPPIPMLGFLLLLKLSYFGAFTAACGQTIGKMAAHIRVVSDDVPLDPARAIRRTVVSAFSLLAFGAGFIPALVDPEHRALHDRVARTRVVELPSV